MRNAWVAILLVAGAGCSSDETTPTIPTAAPSFVDVTESAGIVFEPADPLCVSCENWVGGAVAIGDYDGDGDDDIYLTRRDTADMLFRNESDGTFVDVAATAGLGDPTIPSNGAAWADIDSDGDLDLLVTTQGATRHYLFVNTDGQFREDALARGVALESEAATSGFSASFGDFDRDGWLDLHITEWRRELPQGALSRAVLLRNRGESAPGFFEDVTDAAGVSLAALRPGAVFAFTSTFSDLDDDGWPDLAIAGDFGTSRLFWNNQDGTFTDGTLAAGVGGDENGMGSAIGDYDGDGRLDWFVTSIFDPDPRCPPPCDWGASGNRLYRNRGDRTFEDTTEATGVRDGGWGWGASFLDYDNDSHLDLVMTNGTVMAEHTVEDKYNDDPMRLWRSSADGFVELATSAGLAETGPGKGLAIFDYDQDGDQDIVVVNDPGGPRLFRNDGGNRASWLRLKLQGQFPNQAALGARVELFAPDGSLTQVREVRGGNQFLGQSETIVHFGLGATERIGRVRVRWPDGTEENVAENAELNQVLLVRKR